jgi:hypothetical protein
MREERGRRQDAVGARALPRPNPKALQNDYFHR